MFLTHHHHRIARVLPGLFVALLLGAACTPRPGSESGGGDEMDDLKRAQAEERQRLNELERKLNAQNSRWMEYSEEMRDSIETWKTAELGVVVAGASGSLTSYDTVKTAEVFFEKNEYALDSRDLKAIDAIAMQLASYPRSVLEIRGHADRTGARWWNYLLSEQRAQSVSRYIVQKYYVPLNRIHVLGFGYDYPKYDRAELGSQARDEQGGARDRRVEIMLLKPGYEED